jgi:GNAT superfamily N-acetyltransferase
MVVMIRDAVPADRQVIVDFNRLLAIETEHTTLDQSILEQGVARALAGPDRLRYWVAELAQKDGPRVVGQTAVSREWSDWRNGWIWWLQSVYVATEFRGQGVFRALYQHLRQEARSASDVIGLRLYVDNENVAAQQTYQAIGLKPGGYSVLEEFWPDRIGPAEST